MFRKLVSYLSFSPALIHEVGFYARRLKKEEATRRLTLVFMALALIVQSLAMFSPPESANAASEQDILRGGVSSKEDFVTRYKANESNVRDILTAAGITPGEVEQIKEGSVHSKDNGFVMGRLARFGETGGEVAFEYIRSDNGQADRTYLSPLNQWDTDEVSQQFGTSYQAFVGSSSKLGWFAILKNCGNLVTKTLPKEAVKPSQALKQQLAAINMSQGNIAADTVTAEPGDRISYTITAQNDGTKKELAPLAIALDDALEYATLIDNGGGLFDEKTRLLSWQPVTLAAHHSERRTFVVQILDPIPATPKGKSNGMSYDCVMTSAYGTNSSISIACPTSKDIETTIALFPTIGTTGNLIYGAVVGGLIVFFYFRTRQLKEEIRLIRHNLNQGTL